MKKKRTGILRQCLIAAAWILAPALIGASVYAQNSDDGRSEGKTIPWREAQSHVATTAASEDIGQDPEDAEYIETAISAKGARWHASETSMSKLSHAEKRKYLGMDEAGFTNVPPGGASGSMATAAPATIDWRNAGGIGYVSPVRNQGSCGSCWAFAVTAALESQAMISNGGKGLDLSEQILVSCSGAGSCSGGYPSSASTYIANTGLPAESYFPYTATNNSCSNALANWQSNTNMVNGWHSVSGAVDAIKSAVSAYGPVVATMYVYNDFYSYRSGVYSYVTGPYLGAHAVLVVGYDDANQSFAVKNSWGTGWGEAGFFQIAYSEVTGTSRFGYSVLAYDGFKGVPPPPDTTPPTVSISAPVSGATVSGTATVSASASDNVGVASVAFYVDGALTATDATSAYSFSWNTLTASNGSHTLQAVAADMAANSTSSAPVWITVYNAADTTPPAVTITSPANGSTVSKTIKIKATASDASPVRSIEAWVDGKMIGSLSCTANPCSSSFNWNTNSASKGAHLITVNSYDAASNKGTASVTVTK
jgi:C1A family cysteine protease